MTAKKSVTAKAKHTSKPKTSAERLAAYRAKHAANGMRPFNFYLTADAQEALAKLQGIMGAKTITESLNRTLICAAVRPDIFQSDSF